MENSKKYAENIVKRIDCVRLGIEPSVIISFLLPLFVKWLACLWDNDATPAERVKQRIERLHAKDPQRLRERVAKHIYRHNRKRVEMADCEVIASATIAEVLEAPGNAAALVAAENPY